MNSITRPKIERRMPKAHYVAVLQPSIVGEWQVLFPDVPACEAHGFTAQDATFAAATALARCAEEQGDRFPTPRPLSQIECDREWLSSNKIDLIRSVVIMVPLFARADET
jgi:predicted RNase H-like HicB family nuclease